MLYVAFRAYISKIPCPGKLHRYKARAVVTGDFGAVAACFPPKQNLRKHVRASKGFSDCSIY